MKARHELTPEPVSAGRETIRADMQRSTSRGCSCGLEGKLDACLRTDNRT